ncbi:putative glycosyltransferase At3g07620 isoform X2 [Wolffia australiana]
MEILRSIDRLRKRYLPGIGVPLVIMMMVGIAALYFQRSSLFSTNDLIRELRKKNSSSIESSAPPPSNGGEAPNNSYHDHDKISAKNYSAVAPISASNYSSTQIPISAPAAENGPSPKPQRMVKTNGSSIAPASPPVDRTEEQKREETKDDVEKRICPKRWDPRKRRRNPEPVRSIQDMAKILRLNQRFSCSMARAEIINAPVVDDDPELYPPVYRNFSTFKRSYELMEKTLKVYVYKEGEKPIIHGAILWGIYAAEGWFMKHMEAKNSFLVDDPSKAHLFYMPFSSTNLRMKLFDPKSPRKRNLVEFLQAYVTEIATKHPFWNRTGGTDHFSVSCHDWASYLTAKAMGSSIRALCNGDLSRAFELGKDVSVTLTSVRDVEDPARNAGGRPGEKRDLLAFFAGQMHGYVRPLLLQRWGDDKDPDIKVLGPLRKRGKWDKTTYINSMRRTKYCLCPRGYEANSPRLAEAFFYECVPVIISDNFVPPFFEVLNWEAFSVVVPVNDIPRLKEILLAIPREKYLALQYGVKKVQRHFLWHSKPERYDLFHMTLHSVWFNRVFQLRVR